MEGGTISNLELIITECLEELKVEDNLSRDEYLATLVYERIRERSQRYEKEFDKYLTFLESDELHRTDFSHLARSLESLSFLVTSSYDSLLKEVLNYQEKFFN